MLTFAEPRKPLKNEITSTDKPLSARRVWRILRRHEGVDCGIAPFRRRTSGRFSRVMETEDGVLICSIGDRQPKRNGRCTADSARSRCARAVCDLLHAVGEKYSRGTAAILAAPRALLPILHEYCGGIAARGIANVLAELDISLTVVAVSPNRRDEPQDVAWSELG